MSYRIEAGLWQRRIGERTYAGRPALFLDRDGVLVEEVHFLSRIEDIRLIDGVAAAIADAKAADVAVVIVTNQSGIARGLFGWEDFEAVQEEILLRLARAGADIDLVLACGYHPDGVGEFARDHSWRKPGPGMLEQAFGLLSVSPQASLIVGDRFTDLAAGKAAGLRQGALVATGYGSGEMKKHPELAGKWSGEADFSMVYKPNAALAISEWLRSI